MTESNAKITSVGKNASDTAALVWSVADDLVGAYKPHEYGNVILPMTVVKRFHDCLLPKQKAIQAAYKKCEKLAVKAGFLRNASGYAFYNTSPFTFQTLCADPDNIEDNFRSYINGFSDNVLDILAHMDFDSQIKRMSDAGLLYQVVSDFNTPKADFSPEKIKAVDMGYVFENLVRRFSESYDEEAGAHFTSRDIIYLMTDLLISGDDLALQENAQSMTVYDMTMGTSQMLTCMEERIKQKNPNAEVDVFGQEFNPFTFGIAKADMLIRGGAPENMQFGDTLSDDKFPGYQFDYIISNPPFGIPWNREAAEVEKEYKKGAAGRFAPGLPAKGDGQMLFLLNGTAKLNERGRMAIIQNGSPLFGGDAGSGQSEIRRALIKNDWLDAIVQLPNNVFYNTGIATYVWIVTKNKPSSHARKVLLVDASGCYSSRRKNIGTKNVDITEKCRELVVEAYARYRDEDYEALDENGNKIVVKSKLMNDVDFGYQKIVVESPLLDENGNPVLKKGKPVPDASKRDTENVPLDQDVDVYFEREVLPYNPNAWIDHKKTKIGYEIPFTRTFYQYQQIEPADEIAKRIQLHEKTLMAKLKELFAEGE